MNRTSSQTISLIASPDALKTMYNVILGVGGTKWASFDAAMATLGLTYAFLLKGEQSPGVYWTTFMFCANM